MGRARGKMRERIYEKGKKKEGKKAILSNTRWKALRRQ